MKLRIWHTLGALTLLASASSVTSAHAWTRFRNGTPNTVWVTHAVKELSNGLFSSCDSTGCGTSFWRLRGWWAIAPGGTVTVWGGTFHNFFQKYHADDDFGHRWVGSQTFCTPNPAFDFCSNLCQTGASFLGYRDLNNVACCGFLCGGDNDRTVNLTL
jgi:uncharacterized membrane protein